MTKSIGNQAMELVNQLSHQQPPTVKPQPVFSPVCLKVTSILWDKFTIGYQHLWSTTYGAIGGDEYMNWCKALSTVEPSRVMAAIGRSVKECTDFPPNLVKFLRFCREEAAPYHQPVKFLPAPERKDPSAKERHFRAVKELLG